VARNAEGVSFFVAHCGTKRHLEREVRVLIVERGAPMSSLGSFALEGSLDDSGSFVIAGAEFDDFAAVIHRAGESEELRFQGTVQSSVRQSRFEFRVGIPVLQKWLADEDGDPFIYRNHPVKELPQAAIEQRCGVTPG
jgi:hypothetical protein